MAYPKHGVIPKQHGMIWKRNNLAKMARLMDHNALLFQHKMHRMAEHEAVVAAVAPLTNNPTVRGLAVADSYIPHECHCGEAFPVPMWHCEGCHHHWVAPQGDCPVCVRDARPTVPMPAYLSGDGRREQGRGGYVYIAQSESLPEVWKIGLTRDVPRRMKQLSSGMPKPFKVKTTEHFKDCLRAEELLHKKLAPFRVSRRREFFSCPYETALNELRAVQEHFTPIGATK